MKKLICILCLMGCLSSHAQKIISLEGPWDFAIGDEESSGHKAKDSGNLKFEYLLSERGQVYLKH